MAGSAQSARSGHPQELHKHNASNHLRGDTDQAREGPWRVGASLLKSDLALAEYAKCNRRQCKMQDFTSGNLHPPSSKLALNMNVSPDTHSNPGNPVARLAPVWTPRQSATFGLSAQTVLKLS